ncbi:hypothetical protein A2715_05095 [Candidatus Woesebacteria bacterium RIFCSPHIGHO2_01_FULL_39_32]|uniref:Glycosyltransferase RgtA/B/C/D-like domain-containing protein n=1 Tax=Candidatus Woesebacteria bacterium RIFCSPLOWO2_01_FULL_39_25 TaxID=1802521 RepID=A0A1F8BLI6_9BACT|nr:MAG: hypothetical protein A2715_05095 [Candidatus Woesebacteria bacterium RIFCSPHIGHO2_01_FULL_39_32]OGM38501.1 MAG: hypothetical protein A3F01_04055 [Candidatus Woesebacteria bacterium RIFCSPHIGHO2_12_FULL_38_11]OGM64926.1 MAG: hypothetical protein A2893_04705 [Candidatus Woesebacteria bacterium RIFCSPLOWO2_01_FULL_39_25]
MLGISIILFLIIITHIFLLSKLVFFPYPELFIYSYLTKIGLVPYKQIFDQHFPGIMFFPINLTTLGIDTVFEMRLLHFAIISLTQILLFVVVKKLFNSNLLALASNILYLIWQPFFEGYVLWIDSFIPLFLLPALYFLVSKKSNKSILLSGLFLGTALLFKQVAAPLIFMTFLFLILTNKPLKKNLSFLLGLAVPILILVLFVTYKNIWEDFIYWSVTFNLTTFAEMGSKLPDLFGFIKVLPLFAVSFVFLALTYFKKKSTEILMITFFIIGSLVFSFARFDYIHLQPAVPFAIIGIVLGLKELQKKNIHYYLGLYLLFSILFIIPFYKASFGDKVLFFGDNEEKISNAVLRYVNSGNSVFAFGTTPHLYYLTKTRPPGNVFVFQFPWFMVEAEEKILQGIITDPPEIIVRDKNAEVENMNLVKYMPKIKAHIDRYYKVVDKIDGTEIMVKN